MDISAEIEDIRKGARGFLDRSPKLKETFFPFFENAYANGAIEAKTKHLIALCGGLVAGCTGCIVGQTDMALQKGATVQEVLETCGVAMSLGGTMAWSHVAKVMLFLEENGRIEEG